MLLLCDCWSSRAYIGFPFACSPDAELAGGAILEGGWVRQPGGGRKALAASDPGLRAALLALVLPSERGDPMSPLRWTCKSLRRLAAELAAQGHPVSHTVVGTLLKAEGFSLAQSPHRPENGQPHLVAQTFVCAT